MTLVPMQDVRDFLPSLKLSDRQLIATDRLVAGWLRDATKQQLPAELPEEHPLYGAAAELTVLRAVNPEGLASVTNGPTTRSFAENIARRAEILAAVSPASVGSTSASGPAGVFPVAQDWPDPAERPRRSAW